MLLETLIRVSIFYAEKKCQKQGFMGKTVTFYNFTMRAKVEPILPTPSPVSYFLRGVGWMIKYRFVKSLWQKRQFFSLLTLFVFSFFFHHGLVVYLVYVI